jgi:NTE family protein
MNDLNVATKTIPTPVILTRLKQAGEAAADTFLRNHKDDLGQRSSLNLSEMFN